MPSYRSPLASPNAACKCRRCSIFSDLDDCEPKERNALLKFLKRYTVCPQFASVRFRSSTYLSGISEYGTHNANYESYWDQLKNGP